MVNRDYEILFPTHAIEALRASRGDKWKELIEHIRQLETNTPDRIAFTLMMARLGSCTTCQSDSFKAMRGCSRCATQMIERFRGSDQDLLKLFEKAQADISRFLENKPVLQ